MNTLDCHNGISQIVADHSHIERCHARHVAVFQQCFYFKHCKCKQGLWKAWKRADLVSPTALEAIL